MKIKYKFATGEIIEIEVEDNLSEVIFQIEKDECNCNRRETRRHESYSDDNDKQETLVDRTINIEEMSQWSTTKEVLYNAIQTIVMQLAK